MTGRHVFYEGRVQGVGFRWTTKNVARGYDVTGWVKNLPDGRVELKVCGEIEEVEGFLTAVAESDLKSHIKHTEVQRIEPFSTNGFEILR